MLPGVDGFTWSAGHLVFLSLFFAVALAIGVTLSLAIVRAARDFRLRRADVIRWKANFEDLPERSRLCRHELSGEVRRRTCENGFECRTCPAHLLILKARQPEAATPAAPPTEAVAAFGFEMPPDRLYHRGHTWVRRERDGTLLVGLDGFGSRLLGGSCELKLPAPGMRLGVNGVVCRIRKNGAVVRILSPIEGEVVEQGSAEAGWLVRLKPVPETDTRHLLQGTEVRRWILREIERLELALAADGVGLSLADGGEVVGDVPAACPGANWPEVWSELFLDPR